MSYLYFPFLRDGRVHCKWRTGENQIYSKCLVPIYVFPEMKLLCPKQNHNVLCLPVPTLTYLWEIYIFPGLVCLFCCRKICGLILGIYINRSKTHECGNWDWGRAILWKGIHKKDFRCSVNVETLLDYRFYPVPLNRFARTPTHTITPPPPKRPTALRTQKKAILIVG